MLSLHGGVDRWCVVFQRMDLPGGRGLALSACGVEYYSPVT